jgi:hypothetical protein
MLFVSNVQMFFFMSQENVTVMAHNPYAHQICKHNSYTNLSLLGVNCHFDSSDTPGAICAENGDVAAVACSYLTFPRR